MAPDGRLFYQLLGGNLYDCLLRDNLPPLVPAENMLVVQGLTMDGYEPLDTLALAQNSFGMAIAAERHAAKLFENGTRLSGVLKTPKPLTDEIIERLLVSWRNMYAGTENAHKVALLEDGLEFQQLGMTSADAQLLESRKFQAEDVTRRLHIPPHKLGFLDRATFSNVEQQSIEYVTGPLTTIGTRVEMAATAKLLRPEEIGTFYLDFDFSEHLRGDFQSMTEAVSRLVQSGLITVNEARRLLRLPPIAGGDTLRIPLHLADASGAAAPEKELT
jgi:HK97 family phage portal protein